MALWPLLEVLLALAVIVFIATQVIMPVFLGTPLFPLFKMKKEDEQLTEVTGEIQKERLRIEIEKLNKELDKLHKRTNTTPKEGL